MMGEKMHYLVISRRLHGAQLIGPNASIEYIERHVWSNIKGFSLFVQLKVHKSKGRTLFVVYF
jgi:hypothetical protein